MLNRMGLNKRVCGRWGALGENMAGACAGYARGRDIFS